MRRPAQNHPRGAHTQPPPGSRGDTRPRRCLSHAHARSALRTCWRWRPCSTTSRRTPGTRRRCSAPDRASPGPARGGPRQAGDGGARAHRRSAAAVRGRAQRKWCTRTLAALRSGRAICVGGAAQARRSCTGAEEAQSPTLAGAHASPRTHAQASGLLPRAIWPRGCLRVPPAPNQASGVRGRGAKEQKRTRSPTPEKSNSRGYLVPVLQVADTVALLGGGGGRAREETGGEGDDGGTHPASPPGVMADWSDL